MTYIEKVFNAANAGFLFISSAGSIWSPSLATTTEPRVAADGTKPGKAIALQAYVGGRTASRTVTFSYAGATASVTVPATADSGGSAIDSGWRTATGGLFYGNYTGTFTCSASGGFRVGRAATSGGSTVFTSFGSDDGGPISCGIRYAQSPTAPTAGTFTQDSPTAATLTWSTPSDDGGSAITGYRIVYATNISFTGATTLNIGVATSRQLTGLTPGVTYYAKVAATNAVTAAASTSSVFSSTKQVTLVAEIGDLDGWETFGSLPVGLTPLVGDGVRRGSVYPLGASTTGLLREITHTGTGSVTISTIGLQRTLTGLTIGATYQFDVTALSLQDVTPQANIYRLGVVGIGTASTASITDTSTPVAIPQYEFVATDTSHTLRIYMAENASWSGSGWFEAVAFYNITVTEIPNPSPYDLRDVAVEASLADHFTLACDTVGAAWWVDREDVTRFRQAESQDAIVASFSDDRDSGYLEYIDLQESYDTRNTVNSLSVTNRGRDDITGDALDISYAVSDAASVALWGVRAGDVEMCLYHPDGDTTLLEERLEEVLADFSTPQIRVSSLLWNAQENPAVAAALDVQDRVRVEHDGVVQDCRIVGITHTLTGTRWLVRLELVGS